MWGTLFRLSLTTRDYICTYYKEKSCVAYLCPQFCANVRNSTQVHALIDEGRGLTQIIGMIISSFSFRSSRYSVQCPLEYYQTNAIFYININNIVLHLIMVYIAPKQNGWRHCVSFSRNHQREVVVKVYLLLDYIIFSSLYTLYTLLSYIYYEDLKKDRCPWIVWFRFSSS